jgi:hypothetical protein
MLEVGMFRMLALSVAALVVSAAAGGPALAQRGDVYASGGQAKGTDCTGIQRAADDQASIAYETRLKGCGNDAGCRQAAMDAYQQRRFENLHDTGICANRNKKVLLQAQISEPCALAKGEADLDAEIAKTQAEKACDRRDAVCNMAPMKPFEDKLRANLAAYSACLKRVGAPPEGPSLGRVPPTGQIPPRGPCAYPRNSVTCQLPSDSPYSFPEPQRPRAPTDLGSPYSFPEPLPPRASGKPDNPYGDGSAQPQPPDVDPPPDAAMVARWRNYRWKDDQPGWNDLGEYGKRPGGGDYRAYRFENGQAYEFPTKWGTDPLDTTEPAKLLGPKPSPGDTRPRRVLGIATYTDSNGPVTRPGFQIK